MTTTPTPSTPVHPTQITEAAYLADRVDNQIDWYSRKSSAAQSRHKQLRMTEVVAAAAIPLLSGMGERVPGGPWIIGILGACVAIAAATSGIFKYHENWIQYRATSEQLKHEKYLFLARVTPYGESDAFQVLVQRIEGLISKENSTWTQTVKAAPTPSK
jgi:Protein of unknown function (DUF4231)